MIYVICCDFVMMKFINDNIKINILYYFIWEEVRNFIGDLYYELVYVVMYVCFIGLIVDSILFNLIMRYSDFGSSIKLEYFF